MRFLAVALLGMCTVCGAQPSLRDKVDWRFFRVIDKFTDKVSCEIHGPSNTPLMINFVQGEAMLASRAALAVHDQSVFTVRVDKNPAMELRTRELSYATGAVPLSDDWLNQMDGGKMMIARLTSTVSVIEGEYGLSGFSAALQDYRACLAGDAPAEPAAAAPSSPSATMPAAPMPSGTPAPVETPASVDALPPVPTRPAPAMDTPAESPAETPAATPTDVPAAAPAEAPAEASAEAPPKAPGE